MSTGTELEMYAVYDKPLDEPEKVVVRRFVVNDRGAFPDDERTAILNCLEDARTVLRAMGLINVGGARARRELDEPQIAEVWL